MSRDIGTAKNKRGKPYAEYTMHGGKWTGPKERQTIQLQLDYSWVDLWSNRTTAQISSLESNVGEL